jgi:hypothetical protein
MKTNKFLSILAVMIGMTMSASLVSCGDDDDEPEDPTPNTTVTYNAGVMYKVDLSDDYYTYFDITAVCTDYLTGKDATLTFTKNDDLLLVGKYADIAKTYNFKVVATPKATAPAIESGKDYNFVNKCGLFTYYYDSTETGDVAPVYKYTEQETLIVPAENMPGFIAETWNLFNKSYTFTY